MVLNVMPALFPNSFWLDGISGFALAFLLVLAVSICISYVTYKLVEYPGINLGRHIIKWL